MFTILSIALVQMPILALTPAIARMAQVFPDRTLSEIQTVVSLPNLVSMFSAVFSAFLVTRGFISKKTAVISGLAMAVLTGAAAIVLHTQFWHLTVFALILGISLGFFIPTTMSIMFDSFTDAERQKVTGYQTSFINIGGIIMSAVGGFLATLVWYGGYLAFLLMVPVTVLAAVTLPAGAARGGSGASNATIKKSKLPPEVAYYAAMIFLFMMIYNVGAGNLSMHIAGNRLGNSATAGVAAAVQMAGGVASGLIFSKLSVKLRDYVITLAFIAVFVGYTILNLGHASLTAVFAGVFISGASLSMIIPQCLFSVSKCVDPTNSSAATTLIACFAPGAGGFLSPVIFTNLTTALGGDSTNFRFQFVGIVALAAGIAAALMTLRSEKKAGAALPAEE
jgi:MFS family permease